MHWNLIFLLSFYSIQEAAGKFICKVSYAPLGDVFLGGDVQSEEVNLNVYGIISLRVTKTTANIGDEVTITCTADNQADPKFLWYKNGFEISDGDSDASAAEQISLTAVSILICPPLEEACQGFLTD